MKKILVAALFVASFCVMTFGQSVNIIPRPQTITPGVGSFTLNAKTKIVATDDGGKRVAAILAGLLQSKYGLKLTVTPKLQSTNAIIFTTATPTADIVPNPEKYLLKVKPEFISISGSERGMFYGVESLMQLLPLEFAKQTQIPVVDIDDAPRFQYRGMHLDVDRHFFPVEFVKKYIDLMSQYKFSYFHWHLTDDQGWRIEIKKYPKLTEIGSTRPESALGHNLQPYVGDGKPVSGFYTQEQIKDVVAYAKARYITVIPEIELPGHSSAALAAYPEFGCDPNHQYKVQTTWGIFKEVYCPTDKTFAFLEDVISEVIDLFPDSPYVHIGGDEVLKDMWKDSPEVKALMEREHLKDVNEVQSYFVQRIEKFVNSKGKKIIGWDEILEGGLAPNATVMSWRGTKGGIEAAHAHHDVIMTPGEFAYLDHGQGDPAYEPLNIGGYLPLAKVYAFDPVPKELGPEEAKFIIGGQGNMWTEYLPDPAAVEYMAFPRLLAMSEALWTGTANKSFSDFSTRLTYHYARLDKQNVNYRIPEPVGLANLVIPEGQAVASEVSSSIPGAKILGTVDGSDPNENSPVFPAKFVANPDGNKPLVVKTIVVLPSGRKSSVYTYTFLRGDYLAATPLDDKKRVGVTYAFSQGQTIASGETRTFNLQQFAKLGDLTQPFSAGYDGFVTVAADGIYEFRVEATGSAQLIIDGEKLIDLAAGANSSTAVVALHAGYHRIAVRFNSTGSKPRLGIRLGLKGQGLDGISGDALAH